MMGGMIKVQWESWEGLLILLGEVEAVAWTQAKPAPAPGGLETHPQARRLSSGSY